MCMGKERKEMQEPQRNLMTLETKKRLEQELIQKRADHLKANKRIGEAAGPESDWHDNAAYDEALRQYDLQSSILKTAEDKLHNIEIIEPRQETDDIGLGNTVILRFKGEDEDEKFTVLGPDDTGTGRDRGWISILSPVGALLIGHKEGEVIKMELEGRDPQEITIKRILPGEFSNGT